MPRSLSRAARHARSLLTKQLLVTWLLLGVVGPPAQADCCCETAAASCHTDGSAGCGCCSAAPASGPACCVAGPAGDLSETQRSCRCSDCPSNRTPPPLDRTAATPEIEPVPVAALTPPAMAVADLSAGLSADATGLASLAISGPERLSLFCVWIL